MAHLPVISLFSGAGGLDYGFEAAGFRTVVAVERDVDSCSTLRTNLSGAVIERDIFAVDSAEILEAGGLRRGDAAVLVGGPPCQPFSKAGLWRTGRTGRLSDPRAETLGAYMRVLEDTLPVAFVMENVEGFSTRGKDEGLRLVFDLLEDINRRTRACYRAVVSVLNAASYGVPQLRRRLLVVGVRDGGGFCFPKATHGEAQGLLPMCTAWDAIGDVVVDSAEDLRLRGRWADLLPSIPEGQNYLWHTAEMGNKAVFGWRTRYWSFLLKLAKNRPSWTIPAQPGPGTGPFHWESRRLSLREMCRLQTFPDRVSVIGARASMQRQLGNAVPSLLAEVIARELRAQVFGRKRLALKLRPVSRGEPPPPERPGRRPAKFRPGDFAPHPGTGLGPGARARGVRT